MIHINKIKTRKPKKKIGEYCTINEDCANKICINNKCTRKKRTKKQTLWKKVVKPISPKVEITPCKKSRSPIPNISRIHTHNTPKLSTSLKNPCLDIDQLREQKNMKQRELTAKIKECETYRYNKIINDYFSNSKLSHSDLLQGLYKYYNDQKRNDINFTLPLKSFIELFSRDFAIDGTNFKRQHIFEALCRILLMYNYDDEFGSNKTFHTSLEDLIKNKPKNLNNDDILKSKVNEGSKAGIVDILFTTNIDEIKLNESNLNACELLRIQNNNNTEHQQHNTSKTVLIQNKYYDEEKSSIDKYDVTGIYTLASTLNNNPLFSNRDIILMVNNKEALSHKLTKSKKDSSSILDIDKNIYGTFEINKWFQNMLYDIYTTDTFEDFKKNTNDGKNKKNKKNTLIPRFHQKFITNTTFKYNEVDNNNKKFIWGAVPRSGKTFMIGDFISKRKKKGSNNDIIIILGAKTETEPQFLSMFDEYADFDDFNIVIPNNKEYKYAKKNTNTIYILSQEWFKNNKIEGNTKLLKTKRTNKENQIKRHSVQFKESVYNTLPIKNIKNVDVFFDEIHKGGSTDNSELILLSLINASINIDFFIMVTATFAKPNAFYHEIDIGNANPKIIEWSYNDQHNMKEVVNETKKQSMINSRIDDIEKQQLERLFNEAHIYYGLDYLDVLSSEYKKYPELVLINPEISGSKGETVTSNVINVLNKLNCKACKGDDTKNINEAIDYYTQPKNIFQQELPVNELLNELRRVYNYFLTEMQYPITSPHTELWFLPDKNLYDGMDCNTECKNKKTTKTNDFLREEDEDLEDGQDKQTIANIEPLTRGLAIMICRHDFFNKYNVFVVHNTNVNYLNKNITSSNIFKNFKDEMGNERIKLYDNKQKLSEQIRKYEIDTYKNGKSLIVLTGAKLRLGISLPCVDIAFNFDTMKSIDVNYQTMFRVLTERVKPELKQYGYYVDFNRERSIEFLYEYGMVYGEKNGKKNIKEQLEYLQTLLFSFNYNGLNLIKRTGEEDVNLYNKLIEQLNLNENDYVSHLTKDKTLRNLIKKGLSQSENRDDMRELAKILRMKYNKQNKKYAKVKENFNKEQPLNRESRMDEFKENNTDDDARVNDHNADDKIEDEDDAYEDNLIEMMSNHIPAILSLLAVFSNEYNCTDVDQCIENAKKHIKDFSEMCNCNNVNDANVIDCYMNSPLNVNNMYIYDKDVLVKVLDIITSQLLNNAILQNALEINFSNIIQKMGNAKNPLITELDDNEIKEYIIDNLTIKTEEKDKFGEVFTPPELINEMLDALPKNVWKQKHYKWLDPANGIGNFPMLIYGRLMNGLKDEIKDESRRSEHILKNMLYMVEINPKNVKIARKIFGKDANIFCGSFLEDKWKTNFGDKFDVIVGNPPYNKNGIKSKSTDNVKKKGENSESIWPDFVKISLSILNNENSYLLFVHPASWISLKSNNATMILYNQLVKLRYYNYSDAQDLFGKYSGKIPITYYLIQNKKTKKSTSIYDNAYEKFIEFNIYENNFVPTESIEMMKQIYSYTKTKGSLKNNYKTASNSDSKEKSHSLSHPFPLVNISYNKLIVEYTSSNNLHNTEKKLILPNASMGYPVLDTNGILYPYNSHGHIIVSNNNLHQLKQLQNYLFCNLIFYIIVVTKTSMNFLDNKVFEFLPNITNLTTEIDITDEFLIKKVFKINENILKGYYKYLKSGEGRLSPETIKQFKSFDITKHNNGMTDEQVSYVNNIIEQKSQTNSKTKTKTKKKKKISKGGTLKKSVKITKRVKRKPNKKTRRTRSKLSFIKKILPF